MTDSLPHLPSAPLWRRFAALGYDIFVLGGVSMGYGAVATALAKVTLHITPQQYSPMFKGPVFFIGWLAVICAFFIGFWMKSGQTIGMRAWRIRLVSTSPTLGTDGNPALSQTLKRCLFGLCSLLLAGAGYWYRFWSPEGHCWHDERSNTRVIVVDKHG